MGLLNQETNPTSKKVRDEFTGLKSDNMRTSLIQYGRGFGKLQTIRGVTKYQLSPLKQKSFAGAIAKGLPNTFWRIRRNIGYWLPTMIATYYIKTSVDAEYERLQRKQPGEFDHEE